MTDKLMVKPLLETPLEMEEVYNFARTATAKDCVAQTIACQLITTMQRMEMVYEALERAKEAFDDIGEEELSQICYDALYGDLYQNKESATAKPASDEYTVTNTYVIAENKCDYTPKPGETFSVTLDVDTEKPSKT